MIPRGTKVRILIRRNISPYWDFYRDGPVPPDCVGTILFNRESNHKNDLCYCVQPDEGYSQYVPEHAFTINLIEEGNVEDWM